MGRRSSGFMAGKMELVVTMSLPNKVRAAAGLLRTLVADFEQLSYAVVRSRLSYNRFGYVSRR